MVGTYQRRRCGRSRCKVGSLDAAVKPAFLYMLKLAEMNNDGQMVYGFATDSIRWKLLTFNPSKEKDEKEKDKKIHFGFEAVFPGMQLKDEKGFVYKDRWMERCSSLVDVIYTCLMRSLEPLKPKQSEHPQRLE